MPRPHPTNCPHCASDLLNLGGGWIEQDNNGPIVPCPMCNDDGKWHAGGAKAHDRAYRDGYIQAWREWSACVARSGNVSAEDVARMERRRARMEKYADEL